MHEQMDVPVATPPQKPLPKRIVMSLLRIASMLAFLFVTGCYLVAQPSLKSSSASAMTADAARLRADVEMMSVTCHPRDWQNMENLNRCADYIAAEMKEAGATVGFQEYEAAGQSYRNVIGRFGAGKARKIIIGAHYDSCDDTPGADDNASGVAGLLEMARMIGANPPDLEIELVAYTLEEPPFFRSQMMGSAVHAGLFIPRPRKPARHRFFGSPELLAARHPGRDDHQHRVPPKHRLPHFP